MATAKRRNDPARIRRITDPAERILSRELRPAVLPAIVTGPRQTQYHGKVEEAEQ